MRRDEQRPGDEAGSFHYGEPYGYGSYGYGYGERDQTPSRSFKDYLLILRERFIWLVVIVFTCFLAAWVYTFNSTPLFRAVAAVQVLRQQNQLTQFTEVVDTSVRNSEDLNTQIRILQSANIAKRVYDRIKADDMDHRRFMAPYDKSSGYSGLSMNSSCGLTSSTTRWRKLSTNWPISSKSTIASHSTPVPISTSRNSCG